MLDDLQFRASDVESSDPKKPPPTTTIFFTEGFLIFLTSSR